MNETPCSIEVEALGPFASWKDAWDCLPAKGKGWIMAPDRVTGWGQEQPHRFLAAEVAHGPTSVHVRFDGETWRAWRYVEREGDTHRKIVRDYEGVPARHSAPPGALRYVEYRQLAPDPVDPSVRAWVPYVARFAGFDVKES